MSEGSSLWILRLQRTPGGNNRGEWGQRRELGAAGIGTTGRPESPAQKLLMRMAAQCPAQHHGDERSLGPPGPGDRSHTHERDNSHPQAERKGRSGKVKESET